MSCSTGWLKTVGCNCPQMPSNSFGNDGQSSSLSIQLLNWLYTTLLESAGMMLNTPLGAQQFIIICVNLVLLDRAKRSQANDINTEGCPYTVVF
jgi:hypothetical protein